MFSGDVGYIFEYESLKKQFMLSAQSNEITYKFISAGLKVNPSQHLWKELILGGASFVKRNLISSNPARLQNAPQSITQAFKTNRE